MQDAHIATLRLKVADQCDYPAEAACAAVYEVAISAMIALGRDRLPQEIVDVLAESLESAEPQEAVEAAWTYRNALDRVYRQLRMSAPARR